MNSPRVDAIATPGRPTISCMLRVDGPATVVHASVPDETMRFNRHHATRLIGEARRADPRLRVVVGGAAFRLGEWRDTGADDYATDVRGAIALLCAGTAA
jgi:hypothetical protein